MCELRIAILRIVFFYVIIMRVNWRNLIQIELDELMYSQSTRTINATRTNKTQLYAPVQLHEIGNIVKHDKRVHKLPLITVKMIRHL